MFVSHKIELKPNNKQKTYLLKACGTARFAYNWALAEWNRIYEENKNKPKKEKEKASAFYLMKKFNSVKKKDYPWTKEVTSLAPKQAIAHLGIAFENYFKKIKNKPTFKKKGKSKDSFSLPGGTISIDGKNIVVPMLGPVRMKENLRFSGKMIMVTFSRVSEKWFVSIQVEIKEPQFKKRAYRAVGVDLGIKQSLVTSDGHSFNSISPFKNSIRKLRRLQRKTSKKKKGSKNYYNQKIRVSKKHNQIGNQRKDVQHKVTSFLTKNYSEIAIEDLYVRGLIKNHNLARSIVDVGFGEIRRQIEYKAKINNVDIVLVNRFFPSSKTCNNCGIIKQDLKLSDRLFHCECGEIIDRDYNAALNLKSFIGRVPAKFTPVKITALQKAVFPLVVTSIVETGNKHQLFD